MNNNDHDHGHHDSDNQGGGHCGWVQSMMHNPAVDEQAKLPDWELSLVREGTIMFDDDDLRSGGIRLSLGGKPHADSRGHRVECC
jgi:hypothetical protein